MGNNGAVLHEFLLGENLFEPPPSIFTLKRASMLPPQDAPFYASYTLG
jgi:hypothetical protein